MEQLKVYGRNAIWNKCLEFFLGGSYSVRCFKSEGEFIPDSRHNNRESTLVQVKFSFSLFQTLGTTTEKAHLSKLSLVLVYSRL